MYKMKEEFKVGVQIIDEQHEVLFNIANKTYYLLKDELIIDKYDKLVSLIDELISYTEFHFKTEEAYMEKIGHKGLGVQKLEHEAFIQKLMDIDMIKIDENQDEYILEILKFLNNWLVEHILQKDKAIGK